MGVLTPLCVVYPGLELSERLSPWSRGREIWGQGRAEVGLRAVFVEWTTGINTAPPFVQKQKLLSKPWLMLPAQTRFGEVFNYI